MAYQERLIPAQATRNAIESCWMCGIRLPADQMMPDGTSACPDIRWYCQDTRACTERWTARPPRHAEAGPARAPQPGPAR